MSFLLLLFFNFAHAENWKDQGNDTVTVKVGFAAPRLELSITDKNKIGRDISLVPNAPSRAFVGFSYRWLGGSVSSALPPETEELRLKGESKANDWQLRFNFQRWVLEGVYQQYKGFYLSNTPDFQSQPAGSPFLFYPDLTSEHAGFSIRYITRPESLSMSAAFDQSAQQTESGWSLIYSASVNTHRFATPTSLVPASATGTYGDFEKVRGARLYAVTAGIGVAGTFVIYGPLYLAGVLILNKGMERQDIQRTDMETANTVQTDAYSFKFGLGYGGDRFILGLGAHVDGVNYGIENAKVGFNTTTSGIFLGTRFRF